MPLVRGLVIVLLLILLSPVALLSHEGPHEEPTLSITISPSEPTNFQPAHRNEQARIEVRLLGADADLVKDVLIEFEVTHLAGRGLISTGFHHMEGKKTLGGKFYAPSGSLEMGYIFPIRGNYKLVARAMSTSPQSSFEPIEEIAYIHVTEPFFEVRNAAALVLLLLALGVIIGRIYGKAAVSKHGV